MRCQQADLLMMKYMDGEITEQEAKDLNGHLLTCNSCKAEFQAYDLIMAEVEEMPKVLAPVGFESEVMAKIVALPKEERATVYSKRDKFKLAFAGTFAVLLSFSAVLVAYRDAIIGGLVNNPYIGEYVSALKPVATLVGEHTQSIVGLLGSVLDGVDRMLTAGASAISVGIIALCAIQVIIVRKKNR